MVDATRRGATTQTIVLLFLALIGGVAIGQLGGTVEFPPEPALDGGPPAPAFTDGIEAASRDEILSYARGLAFDAGEGAGDVQRLTTLDLAAVPPAAIPGPLCRIEPLRSAARLGRAELAAGRIVARIINVDSFPYPRLALGPRDTTYWWVDSVATGTWRTLLVSSQDTVLAAPRALSLVSTFEDTTASWGQALARWHWGEQDEGLWVTCTATSTCLVE